MTAYVLTIRFKFIGVHILVRKGKFCTKQYDHPAQLEPDDKEGQRGEASINGVVFCDPDLKIDIDVLEENIESAGYDPGHDAGSQTDFGIGYKDIDEAEQDPNDAVG
jgi:hypothetical protein